MTLAKHNLHVAALLPPHLTREDVIAALHDHNTVLTLQALTTGHKELPQTDPEQRKDTYWYPVDLHPIKSYEVNEVVTFMPGIGEWGKKYITFTTMFQDTPHGIKTKADVSGVVLRAEFRVLPGSSVESEVEGEGEGIGQADWVLVEDVEVQCSWYMMPFVRSNMEGAHRDICRKVVEKVQMEKAQEAVVRTAAKGKARADSLPQTPGTPKTPRGLRSPPAGVLSPPQSPPEKITYG